MQNFYRRLRNVRKMAPMNGEEGAVRLKKSREGEKIRKARKWIFFPREISKSLAWCTKQKNRQVC
jgi:hypothetical protein